MALFYDKVELNDPQDLSSLKKWYISLKISGLVREREIGKAMADETT